MATKKPGSEEPGVAPAAPVKSVIDVITTDEYAGHGGSYVFDPSTGKRTPVSPVTDEEESTNV